MTKIQTTGSPRVLTVIDSPGGGHRSVGAPIRKRSIVRDGHKSSVSMEEPFWDAFREIALRENKTVAELVAIIDRGGNRENLSSAIRVFVLDYCRRHKHQSTSSAYQNTTRR
jgi:predicted DNA-binding ribbon-helix-helix protein